MRGPRRLASAIDEAFDCKGDYRFHRIGARPTGGEAL
jgi:hypothetical protein